MPESVVITGLGIISGLGTGIEATCRALENKQPGITKVDLLPTIHQSDFLLGEIKMTNEELAHKAGFNSMTDLSRTALLGIIALQEAIESSGLNSVHLENTALINGTTVGGMDTSERHFKSYLQGGFSQYKTAFSTHDCGHSTEKMADRFGISGFLSTISTACSSSANTIMQAARMIRSGHTETAIAGGTDALSIFTLNGFNTLKILDQAWCRPFDQNRNGLNLGEGAAYLVLESETSAKKRNAKILGKIRGYGNANDAFHQTASSPEGTGARMAMEIALQTAGLQADEIDYINVHGTGTENNDLSESLAVKSIFGTKIPPYSSTKAYTGHTLGAAGAVEAVFALLSIMHNTLFPCLNIANPMDVLPTPPLTGILKNAKVDVVLSNSFGFGGNCSSLIFSD